MSPCWRRNCEKLCGLRLATLHALSSAVLKLFTSTLPTLPSISPTEQLFTTPPRRTRSSTCTNTHVHIHMHIYSYTNTHVTTSWSGPCLCLTMYPTCLPQISILNSDYLSNVFESQPQKKIRLQVNNLIILKTLKNQFTASEAGRGGER